MHAICEISLEPRRRRWCSCRAAAVRSATAAASTVRPAPPPRDDVDPLPFGRLSSL